MSAGLDEFRSMVVSDGQEERHQRSDDEHQTLAFGESQVAVVVPGVGDFRQDVNGGDVQEGAGAEEHGYAGGFERVDLQTDRLDQCQSS